MTLLRVQVMLSAIAILYALQYPHDNFERIGSEFLALVAMGLGMIMDAG